VVLGGWPGTFASFWQRLGRAGRSGGAAAGVLVAQEDPLDHWLVTHPEELLTRPPEDAIVDATNPYLLGPTCAAPATRRRSTPRKRRAGSVRPRSSCSRRTPSPRPAPGSAERGGRWYWTSRRRPAAEVDLRSAGGANVRIVDTGTGALIGDVDEARAHRQVHAGAVYLHQGRTYRISELDLDRHHALAEEAGQLGYTTRPRSETDVRVLEELEGGWWDEVEVGLARVEVTTQVTGYEVLRLGSDEVIDRHELDLPPIELRTVAVWYAIPEEVLDAAGVAAADVPGSLHAAEHAAIGMLPLLALCDRWDIGGLSTALHPDTGRPSVFVYDGYAGGAGLAERSYHRLAEHLSLTRGTIAPAAAATAARRACSPPSAATATTRSTRPARCASSTCCSPARLGGSGARPVPRGSADGEPQPAPQVQADRGHQQPTGDGDGDPVRVGQRPEERAVAVTGRAEEDLVVGPRFGDVPVGAPRRDARPE
jgi:DEAD/DEAH box helicase domain-containing protein